eukprot:TRINITY_DN3424_c0_g1_i1.p1 TRINITY_DN3424_c0_g1~~TRINITY_DN3424_c0_g1_i1.p1  ORF type:complete len:105 (+),score=24.17 TRINITY_DN3424_c0_g1_i1:462-776(+)
MEPPIIAICCRNLDCAQDLLDTCRANGLKKCSITGMRDKIMAVLVDTQRVETLLALDGKLLVTKDYLNTIITFSNQKLIKSRQRIEKLRLVLMNTFPRSFSDSK